MTDRVADHVSYLLAKVAWHLDMQAKAVLGGSNLSIEQWRILVLLNDEGGRSMSDLAQQAFVEAATLTKMIDRLVSDALVYRAPDVRDRRRVLIFLSAKATRCVEALRPALAAHDARLAERLGPDAVAALQRVARDFGRARDVTDEIHRPSNKPVPIGVAAE